MILTDAGPLISLMIRKDANHVRCRTIAQHAAVDPLITTLPCLTEAMYFVGKAGGYNAQKQLWDMQERELLAVHMWNNAEIERMKILMDKYRDTPMDFADASLVAAAETRNDTRIFTLDSHFYIYRIFDKTPFDILL